MKKVIHPYFQVPGSLMRCKGLPTQENFCRTENEYLAR